MNVLNKGFVELIDVMGDDYRVTAAARTSTNGAGKTTDERDRGLIRYLYRNEHLSPFEMVTLTFNIKSPIFVARQHFRHRSGAFNELSLRYTELEEIDYCYPKREEIRKQDLKNKQSSYFEELSNEDAFLFYNALKESYDLSEENYHNLVKEGFAREQSRSVLGVGVYTKFYWTVNLRNLFHFLELRLHPHAQYEIRVYAEAILKILKDLENLKWSVEIFEEVLQLKFNFQELLNKYKDDYPSLLNKMQNL